MERDFFGDLPSEITTNILSRLPIRSLAISKSVCKPWLNFIDSHTSEIKTPPALALLKLKENERDSTQCSIFEIEDEEEDEDEVDAEKSHDRHYIPLTDFDLPRRNSGTTEGMTANGLTLLNELSRECNPLYICNPITREYTELCCPEDYSLDHSLRFGFGVSKISGQYKVVCIIKGTDSRYVYTLGTGTWRRVEAGAASGFNFFCDLTVECNGNIYWKVYDLCDNMWICGFDVETECFRIFSIPPMRDRYRDWFLCVLRDRLCYCIPYENDIVLWMMKEYQVEDSWTIEYKLSTMGFDFDWELDFDYDYVFPIKLFKDGDILMLLNDKRLIYYSNKTRTFQQVGMFRDRSVLQLNALIFTPRLFSLKNFGFENVISF
ncbi:F-box protein At5g18160-like [Salvia hispanica]|uniref:F-box protein At5g18160-like n=1 Tax=Salvia hispanica TaxID=49212 RepID=UPI002009AC83|nr:F-box protein At5g18160-like [Salvia hispanica]